MREPIIHRLPCGLHGTAEAMDKEQRVVLTDDILDVDDPADGSGRAGGQIHIRPVGIVAIIQRIIIAGTAVDGACDAPVVIENESVRRAAACQVLDVVKLNAGDRS